jgi:hypothetical protein
MPVLYCPKCASTFFDGTICWDCKYNEKEKKMKPEDELDLTDEISINSGTEPPKPPEDTTSEPSGGE